MKYFTKIGLICFLITLNHYIKSQDFHPYILFPTNDEPMGSKIADVNNDGLNDVITGYYDNANIKIQYQNAAHTLEPFITLPVDDYNIYSFDVGDVNQDGLNDIVLTSGNNYGIFYQKSTGGFQELQKFNTGRQGGLIRIGDINNDHVNDIVLTNYNNIILLYQTTPGQFVKETRAMTHYFSELKIIDINNDQLNDLVFASGASFQIYTFLQKPTGTLAAPVITYANSRMNDLAIGDLNNDGLVDVATTQSGGGDSNLKIYYPSLNEYIFYSYIQLPAQNNAGTVEIADLDNDGKNEIIIGNEGYNSYSIYSGASNAYSLIKSDYIPYSNSVAPQSLSIGDINNDGAKDLVFTFTNGVIIVYNKGNYLGTSNVKLSEVNIFPNPVKDRINFKENLSGRTFEIYDMSGKLTKKGIVDLNNQIDISLVSSGNYLLSIPSRRDNLSFGPI